MTKEECMDKIRQRIIACMEERKKTNDSDIDTWYAGILRGLSNALELVGMIEKENNK